ncbi:MAG TPA: TetR/AcrR family transcriptional regulator [Spirochaetia bacterium]|nr:TetR/AcrR family transcriptional regulator [Spirochaetaceae bacterium]HPE88851.1 TetR/AcrR family transcriptional regulator [Spirochaetales bacterium]HRW24800.1 TetR/AcrR family transcriptional regulator [Spirochaetia bacterium]
METTRDRILEVAAAAFAARGYEAVGVQELCESSGITKPTLYYHFGSKEGLLAALFEGRFGGFNGRVAAAAAYPGTRRGDLAGVLLSTMGAFVDAARDDPDFARIRLSSAFCPPSSERYRVARPYLEALYATIAAVFEAAALEHGNMAGRATPYAASFIGAADAYVSLFLAGDLDPDEGFLRRAVHYYMHGIFS